MTPDARPAARPAPRLAASWLAAALALLAPGLAAAQAAGEPEVRYVNKRFFTIPFVVDPNEKQIRALTLYVRGDGRGWEPRGSAGPGGRGFEFQANRDGAFEFAVRAEYLGGAFQPTRVDDLTPSLRVVIDTVSPSVVLRPAARGNDVGVEWDCRDEHLDPSTVTLEFRTAAGDWRLLDAERRAQGQALWPAQPNQPQLELRLTVADRAGNKGNATTVVTAGGGQPPAGRGDDFPPRMREPEPARPNRREPYYLNTRRVVLKYQIAQEGLSGVAGIDLWVADRELKAWALVKQPGADDKAKPVADRLPAGGTPSLVYESTADGLYGFKMVARSGVGLSDPNPRPGDAPDVWVEVDTEKPKAKLLNVQVNPSAPRQLTISWDVTDKNLADTPITLEYAAEKQGPWTDVAANLPNTGRYVWEAPEREPFKFFVRLRAKDKARNESEDISKEVIIDLVKPRAELIDVVPDGAGPGP